MQKNLCKVNIFDIKKEMYENKCVFLPKFLVVLFSGHRIINNEKSLRHNCLNHAVVGNMF